MIRTALLSTLGIGLGLLAAEGMVRLAMHPTLDYTSLLSPGPYCPHPTKDFTPVCPHRRGVMSGQDGRRFASYSTNEHGFRGPFRNTDDKNRKKIVVIGGASQTYGIGLGDEETYTATAAKATTCGPVEVHNITMPGTYNPEIWATYVQSSVSKPTADHIIMAMYYGVPTDWSESMQKSYPAVDGNLSGSYAGSTMAVLYGWFYFIPASTPELLRNSAVVALAVKRWTEIRTYVTQKLIPDVLVKFWTQNANTAPVQASCNPLYGGGCNDEEKERHLIAQESFLRFVAESAERSGAKFSVIFLPWPQIDYEPLKKRLGWTRFADIEKASVLAGVKSKTLPDGHYNPELAAFIGQQVSKEICDLNYLELTQIDQSASRGERHTEAHVSPH